MIDAQRLKGITELNRIEWVGSDAVSDEYGAKLLAFTDGFPAKEEALRDAAMDGNTADAAACISAIRDMLFDIGADYLAADCTTKIAEIPSMSAGSLEAYTEDFLGTVSSLSIDIQLAIYNEQRKDPVTPDAAAAAPAVPGGSGDTIILAVDDNSFFLNTIKTYLSGTDYKLTCVTSGSTALRFLQKHTPNLLIFDIDMPEMDGYELAEKVHEAGITAPIIFLTGNASKEYVIKAVKAGAVDFIVKPISKDKALKKIEKYLGSGARQSAAPVPPSAPRSPDAPQGAPGNANFKGHIR